MLTGRQLLMVAPIVVALLAGALVGVVTTTSSAAGRLPPAACTTSQVRLKLGPLVSEKTEQHTAAFTLRNVGASACSLDGYPAVTLVDAAGHRLSFAYGHRGDQMITAAAPARFLVPGGGFAYFALNKNACVSSTRRAATEIHVGVPGGKGILSLRLPHYPLLDYCPAGDPGNGITVSPIEPTPAATACRSQRACGPGVRIAATGTPPAAATILGTTRIPLRDSSLYTARGTTLFLITFPEQHATTITVERIGAKGMRWRRLPFPLAYNLMDLTASAKGLYAGTSVIKRFTNARDELLRIDPLTLNVLARAPFPARIAATDG